MKNISIALATIGLAASLSAAAQSTVWLGPTAPVHGQRTIVINPDTKWVNVAQGESIRFVAGTSEFNYRFDGTSTRSFDLQQVAPAGALSKPVTVYITSRSGNPR